jgi:hypothetical protein
VRRLTTRRARQHDDSRPGGGALGLRTALPHRSAQRRDGLRCQRQRQHDDAQGSPWPPRPGSRDPSASAGDESSLGSLDALPPATSYGYAEWDFSGVPDPVMFRRFLDATDYWFGYSDDSSAGSYDPAWECCVVIANDPTNATGATGASDGELPPALGTGSRLAAGPSAPPPSPPTGADVNA